MNIIKIEENSDNNEFIIETINENNQEKNKIKKEFVIKQENQILINSKNISKIKLDSYSQTSFEDIPLIYQEENKKISKINNIKENSPIKELNKEIKKSDLDQIALKLIDTLYQNVDKIKKKEELNIYDEKIKKISNKIINMKYSNQAKILECLRKTADSYNKLILFEKLEKQVNELNKIKKYEKYGIIMNDNSRLSSINNNSQQGDKKNKGYSFRMSDIKYYK